MTKVELHPAILTHCGFCSSDSWHLCTMRTGMDAFAAMIGDMQKAIETEKFIRKIAKRCHETGQRCLLPNIKSSVLIQAKLSCKTCDNCVESMQKGFNFTCDDCGRDNFLLPKTDPTHVRCEHCNSRFEAIHFFDRGEDGYDD